MEENVFGIHDKKYTLEDYMNFSIGDRGNLGEAVPVYVYRLMEYSLKEELSEEFDKETQASVFRKAGYRAGKYFANHLMDLSLTFNKFIAQLGDRFTELKMGVLRIESVDSESGKIVLAIAEDADCSGLPMMGEKMCSYDEGFLSGVLSEYTKEDYSAVETDSWATGDRVCRFCAEIIKEQ
jgi:hypothetical protein